MSHPFSKEYHETTLVSRERWVEAVTKAGELYKQSPDAILHGMCTLGTLLVWVKRAGFNDITLDDLAYWNDRD